MGNLIQTGGLKYTIFFLVYILLGWNSVVFWFTSFLLPILLWRKDIFAKSRNHLLKTAKRVLYIYAIFVIFVLLRGIVSSDPIIPITRVVTMSAIIIELYCFFIGVKDEKALKGMLTGVLIAVDIVLIYCYLFYFNGITFDLDYGENIIGNKNTVGNYIFLGVVSNVLLLHRLDKREGQTLLYGNLLFLILSTLVSMSFKIMLASFTLFLMLILLGLPPRKKAIIIFFTTFVIIAGYSFIDNYFDSKGGAIIKDRFFVLIGRDDLAQIKVGYLDTREDLITQTFALFKSNPIFGTGLEVSRGLFGGTYSHNTFVEILAGGGIVLFIPFLIMLLNIWIPIWKKRDNITIVIFLLVIVLANGMKIYDTISLFIIFFILLYYIRYPANNHLGV